EGKVSARTPVSPDMPKTGTPELAIHRYSEQFGAILAEGASARASSPTKSRVTLVPRRHGLSPDDTQHRPALLAAALSCLLLVGSGAASWYAIIGALPRDTPLAVASKGGSSSSAEVPSTFTNTATRVPNEVRQAIASSPASDQWAAREIWL